MTARQRTSARPLIPPLTGLRFVAAISVVLYHVLEALAPSQRGALTALVSHGYLGVSLFFVLSGFILTYTYIEPASGALRGSARDFWWARVARVYPVYLAALVLALPVFVLFRIILAPDAARFHAQLSAVLTPLLLQAWWPRAACQWNCPGWSLSVEAAFYLVFPLLAVWIAGRHQRLIVAGVAAWLLCLTLPAIYLWLAPDGLAQPDRFAQEFWLQAVKYNPVAHLGEFAVGVVTGLAYLRRSPNSAMHARWFGAVVAAATLAVALTLAVLEHPPYLMLHDGLLAPLWAAIILALAVGTGPASRWLGSRVMVRLGEASYALYLVHAPLLGYVVLARGLLRIRRPDVLIPGALLVAGYLVAAVALSVWLFDRVEVPARARIRGWRDARRR